MLTGWDEPGEPFTYASSIYTAPGRGDTTGLAPQALSYVTVERSSAWESADLTALSNRDVPTCFRIEQASPTWTIVKGVGSASHGSLSWTAFHQEPVKVVAGVNAVSYDSQFGIRTAKLTVYLTYSLVIMGAGPLEEGLVLQGSSEYPFPRVLATKIAGELEQPLAKLAMAH